MPEGHGCWMAAMRPSAGVFAPGACLESHHGPAITAKRKAAGCLSRRLLGRRRAFGETALASVHFRCDGLPAAVVIQHAAARAVMMMPVVSAHLAAIEACKQREAALLAVIEALVERARRIGELLEPGRALAHHVRAQVHALDRILRAVGIGARRETLGALLGEIAQRGLDRRPELLLLGGQLETRMQRGDARIAEGANVLGADARVTHALQLSASADGARLLRVGIRAAGNRKRGRAG